MPYTHNTDLPDSVRSHLPEHAQSIYRKAFNNAHKTYQGDDATSARVAWSAVKKEYEKHGDHWVVKKNTKT